jgi:hypothetical protein
MALTLAQKSSVRRHLLYPVAGLPRLSPSGGSLAGGASGWRFFQAYGFLEYKLNNLNPDEEARLTGYGYAAIAMTGPQPAMGDTISVTFSGGNLVSPVTITATMPAPSGVDGRLIMVALLAGLVAQNTTIQTAGIVALAPYGSGPFGQNVVPFPEVAFTSPVSFAIAVAATGASYPQITATGAQLPPVTQLTPNVTTWGYLPIMDGLESALGTTSDNLDTKEAGPWKSRGNEIGLRLSLEANWRAKLSDFLGTPINPYHRSNPARVGALRFA